MWDRQVHPDRRVVMEIPDSLDRTDKMCRAVVERREIEALLGLRDPQVHRELQAIHTMVRAILEIQDDKDRQDLKATVVRPVLSVRPDLRVTLAATHSKLMFNSIGWRKKCRMN